MTMRRFYTNFRLSGKESWDTRAKVFLLPQNGTLSSSCQCIGKCKENKLCEKEWGWRRGRLGDVSDSKIVKERKKTFSKVWCCISDTFKTLVLHYGSRFQRINQFPSGKVTIPNIS